MQKAHFEDVGVYENMILKCILKKHDVRKCTGFQ